MKTLNYIFSLALFAFGVKAFYEGENITTLNNENFQQEIMDISKVGIVVFYNKEGANERLTKEIVNVSDKLRGFIKVGAVNCDENESLCETEEVKEYPQINIYRPAPSDSGSQYIMKKARVVYQGLKKAKFIAEFATDSIVSLVVPVTSGGTVPNKTINYNTFLGVNKFPKLVLCTDKPNTSLLFKALSLEYYGQLLFGEIFSTETDIIKSLNVSKYPTLFYFEAGSMEPVLFEGRANYDGITSFIAERQNITKENAEKTKEKEKKLNEKLFDPMPEEIKTQEDLLECINGYGVCAISILSYERVSLPSLLKDKILLRKMPKRRKKKKRN